MPRRPRLAAGDLAYHVLNRRVGRLPLFEEPADYTAFEKILAEAQAIRRNGVRSCFNISQRVVIRHRLRLPPHCSSCKNRCEEKQREKEGC